MPGVNGNLGRISKTRSGIFCWGVCRNILHSEKGGFVKGGELEIGGDELEVGLCFNVQMPVASVS